MGTCGNCGCETLDAYILLDRSGSMVSRWSEALGSINAYVKELAKGPATVTLATFDGDARLHYDVLRDSATAAEWKDVTEEDARPRGFTPLLDAICRAVSDAESKPGKKKILVVVTDGAENASREAKRETAKAALDRFEENGWQVVFLGADFNAFGEAASVGLGRDKTLNMTKGHYAAAMSDLAAKSWAYTSGGISDVSFNDEDRTRAGSPTP